MSPIKESAAATPILEPATESASLGGACVGRRPRCGVNPDFSPLRFSCFYLVQEVWSIPSVIATDTRSSPV